GYHLAATVSRSAESSLSPLRRQRRPAGWPASCAHRVVRRVWEWPEPGRNEVAGGLPVCARLQHGRDGQLSCWEFGEPDDGRKAALRADQPALAASADLPGLHRPPRLRDVAWQRRRGY